MFFNLFKTKLSGVNPLFLGHYVDPKVFYTVQFNKVPCMSFIGDLDAGKAFDFIQNTYRSEVKAVFHQSPFDHETRTFFTDHSSLLFQNTRMIELANNSCQVLPTKAQYHPAQTMI